MLFKTSEIIELANQLKDNKIGLFPCDTVWGIIATLNVNNIQRCRALKGKDAHSPLVVLIPDTSWLDRLCQPPTEAQLAILQKKWPGPTTFVFDGKNDVYSLPSEDQSIGLRVPEFLPLNLLLDTLQMPLISTSANLTKQATITNASDLDSSLATQLDFVYDKGNPLYQQASAVIDLRKDKIKVLREGPSYEVFN